MLVPCPIQCPRAQSCASGTACRTSSIESLRCFLSERWMVGFARLLRTGEPCGAASGDAIAASKLQRTLDQTSRNIPIPTTHFPLSGSQRPPNMPTLVRGAHD